MQQVKYTQEQSDKIKLQGYMKLAPMKAISQCSRCARQFKLIDLYLCPYGNCNQQYCKEDLEQGIMKETGGCIKCIEEAMKKMNEEEQEEELKEQEEQLNEQEYLEGEAATPPVDGQQQQWYEITPNKYPRCKRKLQFD